MKRIKLYMIIAIDEEKAFKTPCSFLVNIFWKLGIEKNINLIKYYKEPISNIIFNIWC